MSNKKATENDTSKNSKNSLIPIYLLMILKNESSPEHPLTRAEITESLKEYEIEIGATDRKTIPRCIKTLAEYFPDSITEIEGKKGSPTAWYIDISHVPMFGSNLFSTEETNLFIDIISGLNIISNECTTSLLHKLAASLDKDEKKKLGNSTFVKGASKCDNKSLIDIKNKIEKAIDSYREITFIYKLNGEEQPLTVIPHSIKSVGDDVFLNAFSTDGVPNKYFFDSISSVSIGQEVTEIYGEDELELESELAKNAKNIALDTLFFNLKKINYAIKNRQTLKFDYLGYTIKENKVVLELKAKETVFPQSTAVKDGKYYLIAHDVNSEYRPSFYRIDLMTNLEYDSVLDFMERRKFDVKETHEYIESHPYMLPGFSKIGVRFLIDADALDRVLDTFGNNAIPCGEVFGWQTAGDNARKLAEKYPELNFSKYLGLEHNKKYVEFKTTTTDEEIFRFSLENADVVELLAPTHVRERILDISRKVEKRYSKVKR